MVQARGYGLDQRSRLRRNNRPPPLPSHHFFSKEISCTPQDTINKARCKVRTPGIHRVASPPGVACTVDSAHYYTYTLKNTRCNKFTIRHKDCAVRFVFEKVGVKLSPGLYLFLCQILSEIVPSFVVITKVKKHPTLDSVSLFCATQNTWPFVTGSVRRMSHCTVCDFSDRINKMRLSKTMETF